MFMSYEGHRCITENEGDSNPKLMRYFDNLKYKVKSCYNGKGMHNYNDLIGLLFLFCWIRCLCCMTSSLSA